MDQLNMKIINFFKLSNASFIKWASIRGLLWTTKFRTSQHLGKYRLNSVQLSNRNKTNSVDEWTNRDIVWFRPLRATSKLSGGTGQAILLSDHYGYLPENG